MLSADDNIFYSLCQLIMINKMDELWKYVILIDEDYVNLVEELEKILLIINKIFGLDYERFW